MTDLVAGELRGFRRFRLQGDRLLPAVRGRAWTAPTTVARCGRTPAHDAPVATCSCGVHAWYHPADARADSGYGDVAAVIAARGRVILCEQGYRAQQARVEAVALPFPIAAAQRARVARRYPGTAVYRSRRAMLRAHPVQDLSALDVHVAASPQSRARRAGLLIWAGGVTAVYGAFATADLQHARAPVVAGAVALLVGWQAALVRAAARA